MAAAAALFWHSQAPLVCSSCNATLQPLHLPKTQNRSKISGTFLILFDKLPPMYLDTQAQDYAKPDEDDLMKCYFIIREMTS